MQVTAVIPARYSSTRFPGKPLVDIAGVSMIERVYRRVEAVEELTQVIVATDDERIYRTVKDFGGLVRMTSSDHRSGTDRIAEVARQLDSDIIVNVQGDEPLIKKEMITEAITPFYNDETLKVSTLKKKIKDKEEIKDSNVVKVVTDKYDYALYFSRSPLPYPRNRGAGYFKHIGLYVYRRNFLLALCKMAPTILEKVESLEQLRILENGYRIKVLESNYNSIGVDKPEDIKKVEEILQNKSCK